MPFKPDVTVAAVVERDGRFLMVEEDVAGLRVFNQPAGHLERNESLVEAAIRETLEETAWAITVESVVGVYLWESPADGRAFLRVAFAGLVQDHEPCRRLDDGICRALWMTPDEIRGLEGRMRSPMVLRCLEDFRAGLRYPVDLLAHLAPDSGAAGIEVSI